MKGNVAHKIIFLLFFGLGLLNIRTFGQNTVAGIYLSASDFRAGKILCSPVKGSKYKLLLHETFNQTTIKIIIGDSVCVFKKDSVFACRVNEKTVFRFFNNGMYEVMNPSEHIWVYRTTTLGGYKGTQTLTTWFFSRDMTAPLQVLSIWNLKSAFPANSLFHEMIDAYFTNDMDLLTYDNFYKMYKLNRVFLISQQFIIKPKEN